MRGSRPLARRALAAPRRVCAKRCCEFVAVLIPASRNVGGIDVVLVLFRLVTREALLGGVGPLRLLRISARAESPSRRSVDAYFFESFTMTASALRAPST